MTPDVIVYCDGSSWDGFGGAAAILIVPGTKKQSLITRGELEGSTNQRMELLAAIIALDRLWWNIDKKKSSKVRRGKRVVIYSDSAYLVNCFRDGWIVNWRRRGWKTAAGKAVANREMWETLEALVAEYKRVEFVHVKGHNGNQFNELADLHAGKARVSMQGRAARLEEERRGARASVVAPRRTKLRRPRR